MSFKVEVDMDIYYVTIGRKGKDDLPVKQVNKAIETVERLKTTTTKEESLRSLKYLTNYLENLKNRMNQLLEIHDYQKRQEFMENNTVILTTLFENAELYLSGGHSAGAGGVSAGRKCTSDLDGNVWGTSGYHVIAF